MTLTMLTMSYPWWHSISTRIEGLITDEMGENEIHREELACWHRPGMIDDTLLC